MLIVCPCLKKVQISNIRCEITEVSSGYLRVLLTKSRVCHLQLTKNIFRLHTVNKKLIPVIRIFN